MTDPYHVAEEHEAQGNAFHRAINDPTGAANPRTAFPYPAPLDFIETRYDTVALDRGQNAGENMMLPSRIAANGAEEVVPIEDFPDAVLTESQRASKRDNAPPPHPPQAPAHPPPSFAFRTYVHAANLQPPPPSTAIAAWPYPSALRTRPPVNVQPPINIDLGLVEICTWVPDWLLIPEVIVRFMRNGVDEAMLAKLQLAPRGLLNLENYNRSLASSTNTMTRYGKAKFGVPEAQPWDRQYALAAGPEDNLTANAWSNPTNPNKGAWKMRSIYCQVPRENWPIGGDRGLFSQCVEFAAAFPQYDLDTSHIPWIINTLGFQAPPRPANGNRDQEVVANFSIPDPVA